MITRLPVSVAHVGTPPIKCQGIKTKLVRFILSSVNWEPTADARWIEPFLGSGVVLFNLSPRHALVSDTNRHIIELYRAIQSRSLDSTFLRDFLVENGRKLAERGADYYYEVRDRFNADSSPADFLFLNRSCFNGVMRFNSKGGFNVPFGHKPQRFAQAYITKIVNQFRWVARQMEGKDWTFQVADWRATLAQAQAADFVYMDPPYVGRHTDYYNAWPDQEAIELASVAESLPCGFALSMWLENRHRRNSHIDRHWGYCEQRVCSHYYHVGSSEELRSEMDEALAIKPGFATPDRGKQHTRRPRAEVQEALPL